MHVLIDGKLFTYTNNIVKAYDIYNHCHTINPIDWYDYNFTHFSKLIIDGLVITREEQKEV
jgi:hypothetical protein